jgi:hypothetical protein
MIVGLPEDFLPRGWDFFRPFAAAAEEGVTLRWAERQSTIHACYRNKRIIMTDPPDALMLGRTIKTTGITVLGKDSSRGSDWWVCRTSCFL